MKAGTINRESGETWQMFYDNPERVDLKYWDGLGKPQKRVVHYGRRIFADSDLPKNQNQLQTELEAKLWNRQSGEAIAHNIGTSGNVDYRGEGVRAHQQIIFDNSGNLVTTPENGGSYDYNVPTFPYRSHFVIDVEPWLKWGNTPQDSTTASQRLKAIKGGFISNIGYQLYGDK